MSRVVRLDYKGPVPPSTKDSEEVRVDGKARRERVEAAQKRILETYAETFRRLAE